MLPPLLNPVAGAPRYNTTFFCDTNAVDCWMVMEQNASQSLAAQACQSWGGQLIAYPSESKQRMVEAYFRLRGSLPRNYWLSATRPPAAGAGTNLTFGNFTWPGSTDPLPANISASPYTHWSWYYPFTVNSKGYDCVVAASDLGYDVYLGADTKDDYTNSLNYLQNEANKSGWNLATCSLKYFYICEAPSTVFPCYPPPSPPSPPPLPPSPPSPPMPPTCEWHA
jgi:hypothetical protein